MRVVERSESARKRQDQPPEPRRDLRFGFPWYGLMQAQEAVTRTEQESHDHHLLRNVMVPGTG
jgi:hypothetical protein